MTLPFYLSAKMQVAAATRVRADVDAMTLRILQERARKEPNNKHVKAALAAFRK